MAEQKNQNEHLNVEDALTQSEAFLIKYKNAIIGGVVAVIIIVAGFIMYKNLYAEPREEKAQAALFKGQEYFEQDAFEQALNGDSIGYTGFLKVADEYSGTKAANLAKAYAGICYAQLGKYEEAVKMLDSFNKNSIQVTVTWQLLDNSLGRRRLRRCGRCRCRIRFSRHIFIDRNLEDKGILQRSRTFIQFLHAQCLAGGC